jgi:hypothetical protein
MQVLKIKISYNNLQYNEIDILNKIKLEYPHLTIIVR